MKNIVFIPNIDLGNGITIPIVLRVGSIGVTKTIVNFCY